MLCSVSLTQTGTLLVLGTRGDDVITVRPHRTKQAFVFVSLNGEVNSYRQALIKRAEVEGSTGKDTITVLLDTHGVVTIFGGKGSDVIQSGNTNDIIYPGDGRDLVRAGGGDDQVHITELLPEGDTIFGGEGDDYLLAGPGDDFLSGEAGNDTLHGFHGNDTLEGNAGRDVLKGERDNDILRGGGDSDKLDGGDAFDKAYGVTEKTCCKIEMINGVLIHPSDYSGGTGVVIAGG